MPRKDLGRRALVEDIVERQMRRHSTAAVLLHHAIAERLGLGPTDHKCLDVIRERGAMTGSELAAVTGVTTGAITGVVARLELAGYLHRAPDPHDGRKQILSPNPERLRDISEVFAPVREDAAKLLDRFDSHQLTAIAEFLASSTESIYHRAAVLRAQAALGPEAGAANPTGKRGAGHARATHSH